MLQTIKINEEDYTIKFISNKDKNIIILIQPNDFNNKTYYKYESSLDILQTFKYKYFKTFDTIKECIQDIYELISLKDPKYTFIIDENENILKFNFPVYIGAKIENIEFQMKKFETTEKEIIANLSDKVKVLTKRVEILEKENEQLKQNNILTEILKEFQIIKEAILVPYTIDSKIITNISQINLIKSGIKNINNNKIIFKLIFRGTRDGERAEIFISIATEYQIHYQFFRLQKGIFLEDTLNKNGILLQDVYQILILLYLVWII